MSYRRKVKPEEIGLDLESLTIEDLGKVAEIVEKEIRSALEEILAERILRYYILVNVDVDHYLNVSVDVIVDSRVPPGLTLESIVDRAIKRGLDRARVFIKQLAAAKRSSGEGQGKDIPSDSQQR